MKKIDFIKKAAIFLFVLLSTTVISCKSAPGTGSDTGAESTGAIPASGPHEACYGRWEDKINSSQWVIINADSFEYYSGNKLSYRMTDLSWTAFSNTSGDFTDEYPTGFAVKGKLAEIDADHPPYDFNEHYYDKNEIFTDYWYISRDGNSLIAGLWASDKHEPSGSYPYIKK